MTEYQNIKGTQNPTERYLAELLEIVKANDAHRSATSLLQEGVSANASTTEEQQNGIALTPGEQGLKQFLIATLNYLDDENSNKLFQTAQEKDRLLHIQLFLRHIDNKKVAKAVEDILSPLRASGSTLTINDILKALQQNPALLQKIVTGNSKALEQCKQQLTRKAVEINTSKNAISFGVVKMRRALPEEVLGKGGMSRLQGGYSQSQPSCLSEGYIMRNTGKSSAPQQGLFASLLKGILPLKTETKGIQPKNVQVGPASTKLVQQIKLGAR